jgi:hypothetical protein
MKSIFYLLAMAAIISGCIHSGPVPDEIKSSADGFGSSKLRPKGQPFTYPAGIKVVGKPHWDLECMEEAKKKKRVAGSGSAVHFCIQFDNSTDKPIIITFPPGTIFISETDVSQNGLLVQTVRLEVPPQSSPVFHIFNYCINPDRDITDYNINFEPVPVITNHEGVYELANMLTNKKMNSEDYNYSVIPTEIFVPVQQAVNEIANVGEISTNSRNAVTLLPAK